jgi:hypothetical protein
MSPSDEALTRLGLELFIHLIDPLLEHGAEDALSGPKNELPQLQPPLQDTASTVVIEQKF